MTTSCQHCATHFTGWPCLSALRSKLRWWHTTVSMTDHQCSSATSVHRSSPFLFVPGFNLLTTITWLYHVLGPHVMIHVASWHPRFGTCCHLVSRTVVLVTNSSSRALRPGSLRKPTHKRRLWELCLSDALQILDLIDWLIIYLFFNALMLLVGQQEGHPVCKSSATTIPESLLLGTGLHSSNLTWV